MLLMYFILADIFCVPIMCLASAGEGGMQRPLAVWGPPAQRQEKGKCLVFWGNVKESGARMPQFGDGCISY